MTAVSDLLNKWASEAKALRQESLNLPALVIDDCTKELRAAVAADAAVVVTDEMCSAALCSEAVDDEGKYPCLLDQLNFSGENKARTVVRAALNAAWAVKP